MKPPFFWFGKISLFWLGTLLIADSVYGFSTIVPERSQDQPQQTLDMRECNARARQQTGFDPTRPPRENSPQSREERRQKIGAYNQVLESCLKERGYGVR
jgi:hypothetical protein